MYNASNIRDNFTIFYLKKIKSRTDSKDLGQDGKITLNYIFKIHSVDVAKDRVSIRNLVITTVISKISKMLSVFGHLGE